jgi:DNA-binding transcriptional regulator LsrR (DeoR family)
VTARLAEVLGASVRYLHAPMLETDAAMRAGLLRDPHIHNTLEVAGRAETIVSSVVLLAGNTDSTSRRTSATRTLSISGSRGR